MPEFNTIDTGAQGSGVATPSSTGSSSNAARVVQGLGTSMQTLGNLYATSAQHTALTRQAAIRARTWADQAEAALVNARAQQALNSMNASRADLEAWYMQADLRVQTTQMKAEGRRARAALSTAIGASGVTQTGSALDVLTEQTFQSEYAVRRALAVGNRAITAKQTEATDFREQAIRVRQEGFKAFDSFVMSGKAQFKAFLAQSKMATTQAIFQGAQGAISGASMGV